MQKKVKSRLAIVMAIVMLVTALTFSTTSSVSAAEPEDTIYKNGVVEYIVATTNATEIIGYELHARYNTEVASAVDIQNMIEFPGGEFDYSNKDIYGNYKASLYAADSGYFSVSLDAGQGFVKVIFEIKDTTTVGDIITLDSSEYYSAGYQTCTRDTGDIVTSFNILDYGDVPEPPEEPTTEEPTEEPTEAPTEEPTTEAPTEEPTEAPTEEPTTEAPTEEPTEAPTEEPTTEAPTEEPTEAPTEEPTTEAPTEEPTEAPTEEPTTEAPTEEPTEAPTEEPTAEAPTVSTLSVSATSNMFDTTTQTVDAGESVTINYTLADAQKVDSYLWILDYDTNKLELTGISTPGSASSVAIDTSVPGQVRAGASDAITPFSYAAGDDFVTFVFTAIDSGETTVTLNVTDFLVHEDQEPTTEAPTEELTEEPTTEVPTEDPTAEEPSTEEPTTGEPDVNPTGSDTPTGGGDNPGTTDATGNNTNPGGPATADEPQAPADTGGKQLDSTTTTGTNTSSGGSGAVQTGQTSTAFVLLLLLSLAAALVAVVSRRKQKKE